MLILIAQDFYVENRLQVQLDLLEKQVKFQKGSVSSSFCVIFQYHDEELRKLWPLLQRKISSFFEGLEVYPSLLHGDLWSGNIGENKEGPGNQTLCL